MWSGANRTGLLPSPGLGRRVGGEGRAPVYVGSPPSVRIPLTRRGTIEEELARWRLTVYNKWAAIPEVQVTRTLADLRPQLICDQGYVDLPHGTPEEVYEDVKERIGILNRGGGYIFNTIHNIQADVSVENIKAMVKAIEDSFGISV